MIIQRLALFTACNVSAYMCVLLMVGKMLNIRHCVLCLAQILIIFKMPADRKPAVDHYHQGSATYKLDKPENGKE